MKLADIGDLTTYWSSGKVRKVGAWSYYDTEDEDGSLRIVYHYGTEMGRFYVTEELEWAFFPTSVGWGSVSDQQGMNKILKEFGWRYSRKNGQPSYEKAGK